MIDVIVLLIIFNDVQFSILIISIIFPRARAPDSRLLALRRLAFTFGSSVLKPDFNLEMENVWWIIMKFLGAYLRHYGAVLMIRHDIMPLISVISDTGPSEAICMISNLTIVQFRHEWP